MKDMTEVELRQMETVIAKEWKKLLDTESIEVHVGEKARRLREVTPKSRSWSHASPRRGERSQMSRESKS